eukprot:CAMPEP_0202968046 /NCGR_PEP_ID=MMETSP1396-20130829/13158_1 /ASSEMBLY_ACC=CAM_ASM_000872 /TAXON_ID= /ORGANISM="Pseudokeronopsis sp., Strain Brazil" /LENGTH=448 /DNA_ID=CAMNT_0049693869 /DNA_START=1 /DNA_END=1347 /DNA_ORIENTATION=+
MLKSFKDAKRRVVESVLEGVGKSEKTVDEEFDTFYAKYQTMMNDLNECGSGLHAVLSKQKEFLRDVAEIGSSVARINDTNSDPDYWRGAPNGLTSVQGAQANKEAAEYVQNVVRSSCALTVVENALEPLKDAIAVITPEIDGLVKDRNAQVIDYDSYRRRVKTIREKKESMEAQGKTGTPAYGETLQELSKFEGKEQVAKEGYEYKNANTKEKILGARATHDSLVNDLLINLVVAQQELYMRAAAELDRVIAKLPQEKVTEVRAKIADTIKKGGNLPEAPKEKSALAKGLAIVTGKAVPSDFRRGSAVPADATAKSPTPVAVPVAATSASKSGQTPIATKLSESGGKSNPFDASSTIFVEESSPTRSPPVAAPVGRVQAVPPPPPPPPAASKGAYMVEALYDAEAEAEDELSFKVGDMIEVLETSDDGWWKGRLGNKEGLFPVNYVKT